MANTTIQLKNSGVTGNIPIALAPGELAINYADGNLYYGDESNNAILFDAVTEPAGLDTEIQFNQLGAFGASPNLAFNDTSKTLSTDSILLSKNTTSDNVIYFGALYGGIASISHTPLANSLAYFTGNTSQYVQLNIENIDPVGSADYVATADVGSDETFYVDLGIQNSGQNDGNIKPLDGFLLVQGNTGQIGGNLIVGTISETPGQEIRFVAGGYEDENVVLKIGEYGLHVVKGDITSNSTTTSLNAANSAFEQANLAFDTANNKLDSSGGTISGDLYITGNANVLNALITNQYLQFADGTKQYTANAAAGGGGGFPKIDLGLITEPVFSTNIVDLQQ
jgi:hypothetical protein